MAQEAETAEQIRAALFERATEGHETAARSFLADIPPIPDAALFLRAVVEESPRDHSGDCVFCGIDWNFDYWPGNHLSSCPWRRAREWALEHKAEHPRQSG